MLKTSLRFSSIIFRSIFKSSKGNTSSIVLLYVVFCLLIVIYIHYLSIFCDLELLITGECSPPLFSNTAELFSSSVIESALLVNYKNSLVAIAQENFPSPHAELLLGMTIGVDLIGDTPFFEKALRDTGTIHVVVVSGFNISLVQGLIYRMLGSRFRKRNVLIAVFVSLLYSFLAGFNPPVVRSWFMGSIVSYVKFSGRLVAGLRILLISALIMVLANPAYLSSISFQLSFLATLGLMVCEPLIKARIIFIQRYIPLFFEDLVATLSANVMVLPLLAFYFGSISLLGVVVNTLILWVVPIITTLGIILLALCPYFILMQVLMKYILYVPLDFFVSAITFFSENFNPLIYYRPSLKLLLIFYLVLCVYLLRNNVKV